MPSPSKVDERFQVSSFLAFTGFLVLFAQALHAIYKKRKKRQAKADDPVALSSVTFDDGPQKPERTPDASDAQLPESVEELCARIVQPCLYDRKDALLSRVRELRPTDTTPEIANVICAYLFAAEDLMKLNRGEPGGGRGVWKTDAELNAAADVLVRETTDVVKLLQAKPDRKDSKPACIDAVVKIGILSLLLVMCAWKSALAAEAQVLPRGQQIDLTRFTIRGGSRYATTRIFEGTGLIYTLVIYPVDAAFRCLVLGLLVLGLPLSIDAVGVLSMLGVFGMVVFAAGCAMKAEREELARRRQCRNDTAADDCVGLGNAGSRCMPGMANVDLNDEGTGDNGSEEQASPQS